MPGTQFKWAGDDLTHMLMLSSIVSTMVVSCMIDAQRIMHAHLAVRTNRDDAIIRHTILIHGFVNAGNSRAWTSSAAYLAAQRRESRCPTTRVFNGAPARRGMQMRPPPFLS
eukprot:7782832-Pyramimonas_sp.AAC.1